MALLEKDLHNNAANSGCFTAVQLGMLTRSMPESRLRAGTSLYGEGDTADHLYFIVRGRVKMTKMSEDGKTLVLYLHKQGDLFGLTDPFGQETHRLRAEICEDSVIGKIHRSHIAKLIQEQPEFAMTFLKWMSTMHRMTETKFRDLLLFGKTGALASLLIRLTNTYGVAQGPYTLIAAKINHSELADMIGSSRENVNRTLSDWKKEQVVDLLKDGIVVKRLDYLRQLCACDNCPAAVCRM